MVTLPDWLYEPLPYVYAAAGLVAALTLDSFTGRISGLLLLSAAGVVGYWRYDYRHKEKQRIERLLWLQDQAHKRKVERQTWLREQAQKYREEIERKEQDF